MIDIHADCLVKLVKNKGGKAQRYHEEDEEEDDVIENEETEEDG